MRLFQAPLPLFITQAIAIMVVARGVGVLARRLRQPMVIAEVVAGILLGPSVLGWLLPSVSAALFPASSLSLLALMSQVGLVLFMFLIGLELDPKLLEGRARASIAISQTSIVLPFVMGGGLGLALWSRLSPPSVPITSFAVFMGVAMSITAFPVLARILVERRLMKSRIGAITIACAAINDVTAWCILAFVVSIVRSSNPLGAVGTVFATLVFGALMIGAVRPLLARLADRTKLGLSQDIVAIVLVGLLLSSLAAELIGIHALFGAFLFGAVLPKQGSFASALADKLEDLVVVFLLPLFFAYSGLRTQLGLLDSAEAWLTCVGIIAVACAGKFGGSTLAARITGMPWRESVAIGVLMNTRGLVELIVLNIGLDLGVLSPSVFTMMVLMALVTTFMTTPLLQRVYPLKELAKEMSATAPIETPPPLSVAVHRFTVLVCVSFERSGPGLVTLGAALAGRDASKGRVYALRLIRATDRGSFVLEQRGDSDASLDEGPLAPLMERAEALSVAVRPLSFVTIDPARDICDVAEVKSADIVLLGWHKPMLGTTMLSGTVHDVMVDAACDVGVLVDRGLERIKSVLVPYLGSEHDRAALTLARRIAENTGAKVTILHVIEPHRVPLDAREQANKHFDEGGSGVRSYDVTFKVVPHETPSEAVIAESARGYDLVIVGLGRQWGLEHASFGLRTEAILRKSAASVLVVRQSEASAAGRGPTDDARARFATLP